MVYGISTMHQTSTFSASVNDQISLPMFDSAPVRPFPIPVIAFNATAMPLVESQSLSIEERIARAEGVLTELLKAGSPLACSWSSGKDSSVLLNLVLVAAAKLVAEDVKIPPIVVTHGSTLVDSPEMVQYAAAEMNSVRAFAQRHQLNVTIEVAEPLLTNQWPVRVIGGRGLPTFPGTNRDCTQSLKIAPITKLRKQIMKRLQGGAKELPECVTCVGTRFSESAERGQRMRARSESDIEVRRGVDANGRSTGLFLSPIAYWETDDVWEYLGMARAGAIDAYSDFEETFRIYSASMATSCVIVAEDINKAMKASKACGARTGCHVCTAVGVDKSMENMLAFDARYEYMRGLNQFRNFISNTRWDMSRRSWLGRTIIDGYVRIGADAYSPAMMEELLQYALTLDAVERRAASAAGLQQPRFEMISIEQLFAIDAMWSLQAFHRPFHALKIYRDVQNGARYPIPEVPVFPKPKEMPSRYLWVGADWDGAEELAYTGLRSAVHELASMDGNGCMGSKPLADGRSLLEINTGSNLEFDHEAMYFVLHDELDDLLKNHHDNPKCSPTQAYFYYASLGMMTVKAGMQGEIDSMLRRSNFKVREGIAGEVDVQALLARSVSAQEAGVKTNPYGKRKKASSEVSTLPADRCAPDADSLISEAEMV